MLKIAQRNEIKQTIKLTTSMQQRINMLQMSSLELNKFILNELSTNSLLEDDNIIDLSGIKSKEGDTIVDNYNARTHDDSHYDFLSNIAAQITLRDYLTEQINIEFSNHIEKSIALYLLDSLLGSGYIDYNRDEAVKFLECSSQIIDQVLLKLQTLDPPGIFARDLKECLNIQAKNINADAELIILIDNLELLSKGEFKRLEKICNVNNDQLKDLITQLKKLNPKPGNGFLDELSSTKIPDLILTINNDNSFNLELNDESIPKVRINNDSYEKIKLSIRNQKDKLFLKEEFNTANNLIKGINDRSKTIAKIASHIINEQANFFTHGIMYFKPLTLSHIAKLVGFNESTVSRATSNKYISTPKGVFELKYFFSSHLSNTRTQENNISSTKVKELIRQIILSEDVEDILSDEQISRQLKKFNINAARRTVTKYREMLGIPTSSYRKRQYNIKSQ